MSTKGLQELTIDFLRQLGVVIDYMEYDPSNFVEFGVTITKNKEFDEKEVLDSTYWILQRMTCSKDSNLKIVLNYKYGSDLSNQKKEGKNNEDT